MKVYLAQILCGPRRHGIIAYAIELGPADEALLAEVREQAETLKTGLIGEGAINPWCGICGAKSESWKSEVSPTKWETLSEALPHLRASEQAQHATRAFLDEQKRKAGLN
jgi:hypothetical protein